MLTLFAMGQKGLCVLNALIEKECKLDQVIIGKDKSVENDYSCELEKLCRQNSLDWHLRSENFLISSKYLLAVSWRWLIKTRKNQQLIIFHDSFLPAMRGFNPLITGLIKGEKEFGVTALFGCNEYDSGPIIDQEKFLITYPIKIQQVINLSLVSYQKLAYRLAESINLQEKITGKTQDPNKVTYSLWRNDDDFFYQLA